MEKSYHVSVNGEYEFELNNTEAQNIDCSTLSEENIHLLLNRKSFSIALLEANFSGRSYTVNINGNTYKVTIETRLNKLIKEMGLSLGNTSVKDEIYAPMPGIILEVNVTEGDAVKKGDYLCVLEAMKMENTLSAPRDGTIKTISVTKGETVDKGKLLIELEKND